MTLDDTSSVSKEITQTDVTKYGMAVPRNLTGWRSAIRPTATFFNEGKLGGTAQTNSYHFYKVYEDMKEVQYMN